MYAAGTFSPKTLNDNWCEDRLVAPEMLSTLSGLDKMVTRKTETDLAYIGERYDVLSRISRMPARESYAIPDDGFRVRTSTNLSDFANPSSHGAFAKKAISTPGMINAMNAPVSQTETRPLPGPKSGFGAALSRHDEGEGQRFWNTTVGDFYGPGTLRKDPRKDPATLRPSGISCEEGEYRATATGMKCGQLCGEAFHETTNPATDTRTQRAWLCSPDASLANLHMGGRKADVPAKDNELSLPLGAGSMGKIRADLKARSGRLCRVATVITQGANMKAGMSVFQDD